MAEQDRGGEARDIPAPRMPVQIEHIREVSGVYDPRFRAPTIVYAYISTPVRTEEGPCLEYVQKPDISSKSL